MEVYLWPSQQLKATKGKISFFSGLLALVIFLLVTKDADLTLNPAKRNTLLLNINGASVAEWLERAVAMREVSGSSPGRGGHKNLC